MSEFHDIDRRVAVIEQIARSTEQALQEIRAELRDLRAELRTLRSEIHAENWRNFRWLLGVMLGGFTGLGAMLAHGLHWL